MHCAMCSVHINKQLVICTLANNKIRCERYVNDYQGEEK